MQLALKSGSSSIKAATEEVPRLANRHAGLQQVQPAEHSLCGRGAPTFEAFSVGDLCGRRGTVYRAGDCGL